MKKLLALVLTLACAASLLACGGSQGKDNNEADVKSEGVMTYAEYVAAAASVHCREVVISEDAADISENCSQADIDSLQSRQGR